MTSFRAPSAGGSCSRRPRRSGTFSPPAAFAGWCHSSCSTDHPLRILNRSRGLRPDRSCSIRDPGDWCYRSADRDPCLQPSGKTRSYQTLHYYRVRQRDFSIFHFWFRFSTFMQDQIVANIGCLLLSSWLHTIVECRLCVRGPVDGWFLIDWLIGFQCLKLFDPKKHNS